MLLSDRLCPVSLLGTVLDLIHWNKDKAGNACILNEKQDARDLKGDLYRMHYDEETLKQNPPELVLARARSRLSEVGYKVMTNNCEHFATFCKLGGSKSQQVTWLKAKLIPFVSNVLAHGATHVARGMAEAVRNGIKISIFQSVSSEGIEKIVAGSNWVGAGLVVVIEGVVCAWDINKLRKSRLSGDISFKEFVEKSVQRVTEGLAAAGFTIGVSLGGATLGGKIGGMIGTALFPGIGTGAGILIGGILGGVFGGVVGRSAGLYLGGVLGKGVASKIEKDDRVVADIDVEAGDHIITYGNFFHQRCHALVTDVDKKKGSVSLIRNTYDKGVMRETIYNEKFIKDRISKVEWKGFNTYTTKEAIDRAESKLGCREYRWPSNDCKAFVEWCKYKTEETPSAKKNE